MITAQFYVGSRPTFDAWERLPESATVEHVTGVWEGTRENTAIQTLQFHKVREILAYARGVATISDNACVLVTFDTAGQSGERPADTLGWGARRVTLTWDILKGYVNPETGKVPQGYTVALTDTGLHSGIDRHTFVPEHGADFIAVTVSQNGDVSPV